MPRRHKLEYEAPHFRRQPWQTPCACVDIFIGVLVLRHNVALRDDAYFVVVDDMEVITETKAIMYRLGCGLLTWTIRKNHLKIDLEHTATTRKKFESSDPSYRGSMVTYGLRHDVQMRVLPWQRRTGVDCRLEEGCTCDVKSILSALRLRLNIIMR